MTTLTRPERYKAEPLSKDEIDARRSPLRQTLLEGRELLNIADVLSPLEVLNLCLHVLDKSTKVGNRHVFEEGGLDLWLQLRRGATLDRHGRPYRKTVGKKWVQNRHPPIRTADTLIGCGEDWILRIRRFNIFVVGPRENYEVASQRHIFEDLLTYWAVTPYDVYNVYDHIRENAEVSGDLRRFKLDCVMLKMMHSAWSEEKLINFGTKMR